MTSSADIFNRLQLFRTGRPSDEDQDSDPERPRPNPATSRVKRCLFGRGNHEENIKFAKRELEKSLIESKKKWNFDFENERPIDGRYEWQTSPYPKAICLKNRIAAAAAAENVENLHPSSSSGSTVTTTTSGAGSVAGEISSSSENPSSRKSSNNTSSDEQICDSNPKLALSEPENKSSSSDSNPGSSSPSNQRTRSRPINQIYRQRKRSKSKVKTQDRKLETEDDQHLLTASTTSKTASVVGTGGASNASQESD